MGTPRSPPATPQRPRGGQGRPEPWPSELWLPRKGGAEGKTRGVGADCWSAHQPQHVRHTHTCTQTHDGIGIRCVAHETFPIDIAAPPGGGQSVAAEIGQRSNQNKLGRFWAEFGRCRPQFAQHLSKLDQVCGRVRGPNSAVFDRSSPKMCRSRNNTWSIPGRILPTPVTLCPPSIETEASSAKMRPAKLTQMLALGEFLPTSA